MSQSEQRGLGKENPGHGVAERRNIYPSPSGDGDGAMWMLEFQAGNDLSFDRIVIHYRPSIFHFLHRTLRDVGRAEDLTQEVFVRVYRSKARYRPTASFRTWLFTIASRLALNETRSLRRRRKIFADPAFFETRPEDEVGSGGFWSNVPDKKSEDPFEAVARKEMEEVIEALLDGLTTNQRAALLLKQGQQLSYSEIGETLGVSAMAVKSLILRARERLKSGVQRYLKCRRLRNDNIP